MARRELRHLALFFVDRFTADWTVFGVSWHFFEAAIWVFANQMPLFFHGDFCLVDCRLKISLGLDRKETC